MQDAYAAAILAKPAAVLGRQLLPLTVGHAHALEAVNSPFVGGGDCTPSDVIFAAWLCSRKAFDGGRFAIGNLDDADKLKAWGEERGDADWEKERAELVAHLAQYSNAPKRWNKGGQSELRVPWTLALFWRVIGGNLSPEREAWAWNMELPLAISRIRRYAMRSG